MIHAFHKTYPFQFLNRNRDWIWFSAMVSVLGAGAWLHGFAFHNLSSNLVTLERNPKMVGVLPDVEATRAGLSWVEGIHWFDLALTIVVLAIGFYLLRNGNGRREAAENALRRTNEDLEKMVAERTGQLAEKEAEVEVRARDLGRSNEDLEQFAYAASHDLQEPLRAITGCVQSLEKKYGGKFGQKGDELIGMIVDGSSRMKAMIEGLLVYSRAGQHDAMEMVDTGAVLRKALADLAVARDESKAEISSNNLPSLNFVKGEFDRLLFNLVHNAIKYRSSSRPKIQVTAERQMNAWIFKVSDNGMGFEPQYADKIFGVFQRLHTQQEYLGNGLGLASVKKIVKDAEDGSGSTRSQIMARPSIFRFLMCMVSGKFWPPEPVNNSFAGTLCPKSLKYSW